MFLPLHRCNRDLGDLIHSIPSPSRIRGKLCISLAWPPLAGEDKAQNNAAVMAVPGNFRPEAVAEAGAAASRPITPGFPPGTAQRPAAGEGCGVGAAPPQHPVPGRNSPGCPTALGGTAEPHGSAVLQQCWGVRAVPLSQRREHRCPGEGRGRGAAATRRCLLHLKPRRVLSPLPPPAQGWPPRGHPGEAPWEVWHGWGRGGKAGTHRGHPRCRSWLGGCTGASPHPK